MRYSKANNNICNNVFLFVLTTSSFMLCMCDSVVQSDHIIRRKVVKKDSPQNVNNFTNGITLNMELTRSILVHQVEAPSLVCYNSTFPYLFSFCNPKNGYYCSNESPTYGCTKETSKSCNEIHMCNTPFELLITSAILAIIIILLITTGCLWCCFCCCCGKCCKNSCPCFAKMQMQTAVLNSPNRIHPLPPTVVDWANGDWTMYGYDGHRTPDTLLAKSPKELRMENQRNQFFEQNEFPSLNMLPSAPQTTIKEPDFGYNSALKSAPIYSPPRNGENNNGH